MKKVTRKLSAKPPKEKRNLETREKYFLENNIQCNCLIGYVICEACNDFYNKD